MTNPACTRDVSKDPVWSDCPNCGHNGSLHPYTSNAVDQCIACAVENLRDLLAGRES